MMNNNNLITIVGSGSSGNGYFIDSKPPILLEAGMAPSVVRQETGFRLSEVEACLITHEHGDHAKYVEKYLKLGIKCYMSRKTALAMSLDLSLISLVQSLSPFKVGSNTITPFEVKHDTVEPLGFLIEFSDERLLYSGDTAYIKYTFKGLTRIMIECNWQDHDNINIHHRRRLRKTHMSLENVKNFLKANDLSKVKEIVLCHISSQNGDGYYFKKEIQELTGKLVTIKE